jgi:LPXTG-motif cell wall-anchored protein
MNPRSTQPRRARIGLIGLTVAALSFVALPGAVQAQVDECYPPGSEECPAAKPPTQLPPSGSAQSGGGAVLGESLPATGGTDPTQILWIASSALLAGVAISGVSLRRRDKVPTAS